MKEFLWLTEFYWFSEENLSDIFWKISIPKYSWINILRKFWTNPCTNVRKRLFQRILWKKKSDWILGISNRISEKVIEKNLFLNEFLWGLLKKFLDIFLMKVMKEFWKIFRRSPGRIPEEEWKSSERFLKKFLKKFPDELLQIPVVIFDKTLK